MSKHNPLRRLLALALSVVLALGMTPAIGTADTGPTEPGGEIITFAALSEEIANQKADRGTSREELKLPGALTATVRAAAQGQNSGSVGDFVYAPVPAAPATLPIPVTWESEPEYDGQKAGIYTFTPAIAGFTVSAQPPRITVTVGEAAVKGTVTAFAQLKEDIRWQNTAAPVFPATVSAVVAGENIEIPVSWEADREYNDENPEAGLYVFFARPAPVYTLAENLEAPRMTVYIPQPQGANMLFRGAAGPLLPVIDISTPQILAEIAVLVNEGRLEELITGSAAAKITLRLQKDLDLSAYSAGEGWVPIGSFDFPFKSHFDGNGRQITGLQINRSNVHFQGLFGRIFTGAVENLGIVGANIKGLNHVGAVAGMVEDGTVQNCYTGGSVQGRNSAVGGVVGSAWDSNLQNCYSSAAVSGDNSVGGVAGYVIYSTVQNCYAAGSVTCDSDDLAVGGIAGYLSQSTVKNCAALNPSVIHTGFFNSEYPEAIGRVAGEIADNSILAGNIAFTEMLVQVEADVYIDKILVPGADQVDGASKTAAAINRADFWTTGSEFTADWDSSVWQIEAGKLPRLKDTRGNFMPGQNGAMPPHLLPAGQHPFAGGDGSSGAPYQIATAEQLALLSNLVNTGNNLVADYVYCRLTADIDLSAYGRNFNGGQGWIPIGKAGNIFKGSLDGQGHTVSGLYINSSADYLGLFGFIDEGGIIKNLGLAEVDITAGKDSAAGGLAGRVGSGRRDEPGGRVENCFVTGKISGGVAAGGICGYFFGTISNCYSTATVTSAGSLIGGIAASFSGGSLNGQISSCYAAGAVSGHSGIGGIAGWLYAPLENCAALNPSVSGTDDVGRMAGQTYDADLSGNVAFAGMTDPGTGKFGTIANISTDKNGLSKTAAAINGANFWTTDSGFTSDWDDSVWYIEAGKLPRLYKSGSPELMSGQNGDMPRHLLLTPPDPFAGGDGSSDTPYQIATAEQLATLAKLVNEGEATFGSLYYQLTDDIDLSAYGEYYNGGKGWAPIGESSANPFTGHFDGNNHTISGLYIENDSLDRAGLFGTLGQADPPETPGTVQNLGLVNVYIKGNDNVGGIAGFIDNGTVENCYVTGRISGNDQVGGIAGQLSYNDVTANASIRNCYARADVTGSAYVGGVTGHIGRQSRLLNCYAGGQVSSAEAAGGVTGYNSAGTVQNCVALNPSVIADLDAPERVSYTPESPLINNYAFDGMIVKSGDYDINVTPGANKADGADLTALQAVTPDFWINTMHWDNNSIWDIQAGKLPLLKNLRGQNGEPGLYLQSFPQAGEGLSITPGSTTLTPSTGTQTAAFRVTGWENWTYKAITFTAAGSPVNEAITITSPVNGQAALTIPANYTGTITVTALHPGSAKTAVALVTVSPAGGGSSGSSGSGRTITPAAGQPVTATAAVTAAAHADCRAAVSVPDKSITDAVAAAQAKAKEQGRTADGIAIELQVSMPEGAEALRAELSAESLQSLVEAGVSSLSVNGAPVNISFDLAALQAILAQARGNMVINITPVTELSPEAQGIIGNRPVYDITVSYVSDLNGGQVTISIPYTPAAGEVTGNLYGVYIDEAGNPSRVAGSAYDPRSGSIIITAGHLSVYGVGYTAPARFNDITDHWAKKSIEYVTAQGILTGTGNNTFSPDISMTRGMLVTALGRLAGTDTALYAGSGTFKDVAANSYYHPYIEWAYEAKIIYGTGKGEFAPDRAVTREEIAVIFANYAKALGHDLPVVQAAEPYTDALAIGSYYAPAVTALQSAGIMTGDTLKQFRPQAGATRAEVSSMLHRYIKLAIDPAAAQG